VQANRYTQIECKQTDIRK